MKKLGLILLLVATASFAQQTLTPAADTKDSAPESTPVPAIVVPAGTRVLLRMLSPVSSGSAQPGNGVYMQTVTPVAVGNQTVIPPGTYVQGEIVRVEPGGKVKGRAELQLHFTSLTFPSGYHQALHAVIGSAPADEAATVGKEGTMTAKGSKGEDTVVVAANTGTGAVIGAIANGGKGAGIGAGIGGAVGIATVLLTRGNKVQLNTGDPIEMVLSRPLTLEHTESEPGMGSGRPIRMMGDRPVRRTPRSTFPLPRIPIYRLF